MYILTILFEHSGIDRRITHDLKAKFQGPLPSKLEALQKTIILRTQLVLYYKTKVDSHCRWETYEHSPQELCEF